MGTRSARPTLHASLSDRAGRSSSSTVYGPEAFERDACGVGCVVAIDGQPRREVVLAGIEALKAVWHRGAVDADGKTGDGAGIHIQIPHDFFREQIKRHAGPENHVAVGMVFLPRTDIAAAGSLPDHRRERDPGLRLRHPRLAPGAGRHQGHRRQGDRHPARDRADHHRQSARDRTTSDFERDLFLIRRRIERQALAENITDFYICSLSCRSIIYKGLFLAEQLAGVLPRPAGRALRLAASRSSTSATRPTPGRPGSWRSRSGRSPTTARSTRCAATSTG